MGYFGKILHRAVLLGAILVIALGLVTYGAPAMAQQEKPVKEVKEEVTVTGTLIPRPTLEAMSPVSTMDVQQLTYQGSTRLEDLLTTMPQIFAAQNSTLSNNSTGTATIDLRGLGEERTLVLIDGKRMVPGDRYAVAPDLNFIPSALVKRVDILTGGASATYGADAVAGVVNFILDKDFEGLRGGISFSGYEHNNDNKLAQRINADAGYTAPSGQVWDGGIADVNLAYGSKFANGKGHASIYLDYRKEAALKKSRRDWTNCSVLGGLTEEGPTCGGSSTNPHGRFQVYDPTGTNLVGDYALDWSGAGNTFTDFGPQFYYNYGAVNYMQRPDIRYAAGAFLDYKWNEHYQGYASIMFMQDTTDAQIAPSGDFYVTDHINCDNPMLSADEYQKICVDAGYGPHDMATMYIGRRNVEGGARIDLMTHTDWRLVTGLKGDIGKGWSYDVYGLHAEVRLPEQYLNDLNTAHLQDALIVDGDPNDPTTWHCRSGNAGCAPWNIFKVGGVTPEALQYISITLLSNTSLKTEILSGKLNADLGKSGVVFPSAVEGIQLALGAEYRKEFLSYIPDQAYQDNNAAGQGGARVPVSGFYSVKELFAETLIPIVQGARGAKDLSLELGYRSSDYNISGRYGTWKANLSWAPTADFKIRGGKNRATRAPNVVDLFTPQSIDLNGSEDICSGSNPTYTQEQCARTGVTAAQYGHVQPNPANQYNDLYGGNPDLTPEIADTTSYGLVLTPAFFSGFTASFDYYKINIKDTIGSLLPDDIIKACATTGNSALCSLIHRDVLGTLWLVQTPGGVGYTQDTQANVGTREVEGVDVNATYVVPAGKSLFSFNLIGAYLMKTAINTGVYAYDCAGYYGNQCGNPNPEWRHLFRAMWETGNWSFTLGWRMVGSVKNDDASSNPAIGDPGNVPILKVNQAYEFPAYHYFDLAASWKVTPAIQLTLGVNNIADRQAPLGVGDSNNDYGPGFYGTYDPYGRMIHSSIQFTF